mmetsp:Transcript_63754/g.161505  ORF Transcript_63754/g.161505 Transcript_63754/m.161505 type:complete len:357 (-) Transcript_63754:281-1351(-)
MARSVPRALGNAAKNLLCLPRAGLAEKAQRSQWSLNASLLQSRVPSSCHLSWLRRQCAKMAMVAQGTIFATALLGHKLAAVGAAKRVPQRPPRDDAQRCAVDRCKGRRRRWRRWGDALLATCGCITCYDRSRPDLAALSVIGSASMPIAALCQIMRLLRCLIPSMSHGVALLTIFGHPWLQCWTQLCLCPLHHFCWLFSRLLHTLIENKALFEHNEWSVVGVPYATNPCGVRPRKVGIPALYGCRRNIQSLAVRGHVEAIGAMPLGSEVLGGVGRQEIYKREANVLAGLETLQGHIAEVVLSGEATSIHFLHELTLGNIFRQVPDHHRCGALLQDASRYHAAFFELAPLRPAAAHP